MGGGGGREVMDKGLVEQAEDATVLASTFGYPTNYDGNNNTL